MTLLERLRFQWSSILLYAKSKAPERDVQERPDPLAEMEREATDHVLNDLAERLDLDPEVFDDVRPPSEQRKTD